MPGPQAKDLTRNYVRRLHELSITQGTVLVVSTRTMEAYVGSSDFHDAANQEQVDGMRAVRSLSSTLKPLLYGLASGRGLATPKVQLPDAPTNFNGFRPENFDRNYQGKVIVERVLVYSLNIPAVRLLADLDVLAFTDKLRQAGFRTVARVAPAPCNPTCRLVRAAADSTVAPLVITSPLSHAEYLLNCAAGPEVRQAL